MKLLLNKKRQKKAQDEEDNSPLGVLCGYILKIPSLKIGG